MPGPRTGHSIFTANHVERNGNVAKAERRSDMPRTATEKVGLRAMRAAGTLRRRAASVRFYAFDGTLCLLIEADSADDARYLCRDVRLEFIGLCER